MRKGINKKKICMFCGCRLAPYSESDVCEVCLDELYGEEEEELYRC